MKIDNLVWYAAEKEELPDLAFGLGMLRKRESLLDPANPAEGSVRIAFSRSNVTAYDYRPPSMFMLRQKDAAETLSWLRVFSRETFPLSQFARVITDTDWNSVFSRPNDDLSIRTDKWASIVLGEAFAQGEAEIEVESLPLSRATACFSAAVARANFIHGTYSITRACAERMRFIADDPRFVKRAVSVDSLAPIWALVSANLEDTTDLRELADIVLHAAEAVDDKRSNAALARSLLSSSHELFGDSVEERVVAFQRMASEAVAATTREGKAPAAIAALIAIGAFLVGRSTSHAFLLRKVPSVASASFVWFGLVAALRGMGGWDPNWLRLAKGIERHLRVSFDMQDPPAADICWTEYSWLAQSFSGLQGVSELARSFPKTLSIEIVPGAVCQFRLSGESHVPQEVERRPELARESEIRETLEQFVLLSSKARTLLASLTPSRSLQKQSSLEFEGDKTSAKPKTKKAYKRTSK